ncbi:MAG: hypothetical protein KatS3mg014_2674 [Actinomycetota bacterium]|nr:MAG: hypothetical protein KatS3mg014_2674 [Actinomycetota bacterium]
MIRWAAYRAFRELLRAPGRTAVSVGTIALSLAILGLFLFFGENLRGGLERFRKTGEVIVFLDPEVENAEGLRATLAGLPGVRAARYYDRDAALAHFRREWGDLADEILRAAGENPLPPFVALSLAVPDPEPVAKMAEAIPGVAEVEYGAATARRLARLSRVADLATGAVGIFLSLLVFLIVLGAIRLAADSRLEEIEVLRIVGATDAFILLPFVFEGAAEGVAGAGVAVLLVHGFGAALSREIPETLFAFAPLSPAAGAALFLLGGALGAFGGLVGVRGLLRTKERIGT